MSRSTLQGLDQRRPEGSPFPPTAIILRMCADATYRRRIRAAEAGSLSERRSIGLPTLIPSDALTGPKWELWRRHLERFSERRRPRDDRAARALAKFRAKHDSQPAFVQFTGIEQGTVLDLGGGPGKFRRLFDPERVTYVGLDPLALPEVGAFHLVQGVAEYLPFKSGTFSDIVILAALDHFRDVNRFAEEATRV